MKEAIKFFHNVKLAIYDRTKSILFILSKQMIFITFKCKKTLETSLHVQKSIQFQKRKY